MEVVTRPSTTILPGGMNRSGSKPPERSSSYSRKKPSTSSSENRASATKSYPPEAAQDDLKLPRHKCVVIAIPAGLSLTAALICLMYRRCMCSASSPRSLISARWAGSLR